MRVHLVKRRRVAAVAGVLGLVGIVYAMAFRYSIDDAVPAGAPHTSAVVTAPPDGMNESPSADNYVAVPFMVRGYCYAGSQLEDTQAPGGYGRSDNAPRRVQRHAAGHGLFLLAQPGVAVPFDGGLGMRVVLVNQTDDLLAFEACDSRLAIIQEAQDTEGVWRPVEYLPASWCGNSYHRVFLAPAHFWAFSAPRYKGSLSTNLRFTMTLADGSQLHSNVFAGSVNPSQFTLEQGHNATNIMDPYSE